MYSFKELRKAAKNNVIGEEIRMAILGNSATQFLTTSILGRAKLAGINLHIFEADYNQIEMQLLDSDSETYKYNPNYILLWLSTDKLYEEYLNVSLGERERFAQNCMNRMSSIWCAVEKRTNAKILQFNFSELNDFVLGQYSTKIEASFIYQIRKLNYLLNEAMQGNTNIYPIDLLSIQNYYGMGEFYDPVFYYSAKMAVSTKVLPDIAESVIGVLQAGAGKIKKCVILDLDNTLWGGVIGDDGINNIEIGELGRGHAYTNLQRYLKELKEYGIILAVCSKNNEEIAKEPFEKHEEMVLHLEDISIFVANWEDKVTNIKLIQETLNIGMDSIVFLDDNPFERELVKKYLPEVTVPDLPEDASEYLTYIQNLHLFETVSYTGNGQDRTQLYQQEYERNREKQEFSSINDYLDNLQMIGETLPFEESKYSRIAQLTQRSNQFNLRTIRYSEEDIKRIAESPEYETIYFTLKDKYGDYGLVSVVILKRINDEDVFVDTWLMSCRVLKRGMEEFVMNQLMKLVCEKSYKKVLAEYIPTQKNKMVSDIYDKLGFSRISDHKYELIIDDYKVCNTYVKEEIDE